MALVVRLVLCFFDILCGVFCVSRFLRIVPGKNSLVHSLALSDYLSFLI